MTRIKLKYLWLIMLLFLSVAGWFLYRNYALHEHYEYEDYIDGFKIKSGRFILKDAPHLSDIEVKYILPANINPQDCDLVFYGPYANAKNALDRPELNKLVTEHNMLLFTVVIPEKRQFHFEDAKKYWNYRSGWHEKIFDVQRKIERHFNIPHRKLLAIADSAGCQMIQTMTARHPEKMEAASWCSGNTYFPFSSDNHPPVLAISAWGDVGEQETKTFAENDLAKGGYSLFCSSPPNWKDKGFPSYHHAVHEKGYTMAREFLADIAKLRRTNNGILPDRTFWKEQITLWNGTIMPAPGGNFNAAWEQIPHEALAKLRALEDEKSNLMLALTPIEKKNNHFILFFLSPKYRNEVWYIDNIYFAFEQGFSSASRVLKNSFNEYEIEMEESLRNVLTAETNQDNPIIIICVGGFANSLYSVTDKLNPAEDARIKKIFFLNPEDDAYALLENLPKATIISNNVQEQNNSSERIIYNSAPGKTFEKQYYHILRNILDNITPVPTN